MHRPNWTAVAALVAMIAVPLVWAGSDADEEAWVRAMTPGEPHARLADRAGEWRAVVTIWEEPGREPVIPECS